jgi:hypothetical protein
MSIIFDPRNMLKKIAPIRKVEKILSGRVTVKKTALGFLDEVEGIDKKQVLDVALKTVKGYKERIKAAGDEAGDVKADLVDDPKQLVQRVQNEIVFQMHEGIRRNYKGQRARWLPSDADEPRPEHQLNYGKEYIIGEGINGIEPGDEYGCKCGVEILDETGQLDLS